MRNKREHLHAICTGFARIPAPGSVFVRPLASTCRDRRLANTTVSGHFPRRRGGRAVEGAPLLRDSAAPETPNRINQLRQKRRKTARELHIPTGAGCQVSGVKADGM